MGRKNIKEKVYRLDNKPLREEDIKVPAPRTENGVTKVHVDLFLRAKKIPLWERGGRRAFALKKGFEFATEKQFEDLFSRY